MTSNFYKHIYTILIISLLILIILLIVLPNYTFIKYILLSVVILLTVVHTGLSIDKNYIIKQYYNNNVKPLQDMLKTKIFEKKDGSGFFSKKQKIAITSDKYSIDDKNIINIVDNYIDILITSNDEVEEKERPFVKQFCKNIAKVANDIFINKNSKDLENIPVFFNNNKNDVISSYTKLDIDNPIIMSKSSIYIPVNVFSDNLIIERAENTFINFNLLDSNISNKNFTQLIFDLKSLNTNNQKNSNVYLEYLLTNKLTDLNKAIDINWIKKMNKYIANLSKDNIYTIFAYSYKGDGWSNNYLRDNFIGQFSNSGDDSEENMNLQFKEFYTNKKSWINNYFPYFFQILHLLKNTNDEDLELFLNKNITITTQKIISSINNFKNLKNFSNLINTIEKKNTILELLIFLKYHKIISEQYILITLIATFDLFDHDLFWIKILEVFVNDLNNIIDNSPPLENPLIVYRGSSQPYLLAKNNIYKNRGFISTTMDIQNAYEFTDKYKCCLQRIILIPGTRCLFMLGISKFGPSEKEILLGSNTVYYISNLSKSLPVYLIDEKKIKYDSFLNMCNLSNYEMKTNDIIVLIN